MYIKGGSVVDGNFYIEGGLRVNSIKDAQGNSYISTNSLKANRLLKVGSNNAELINTDIEETTGTLNGSAYTLLSAISSYCPIKPLLTVSGHSTTDTSVKYFDAGYNALSSSSGATYRTLTTAETTNLSVSTTAKVIPDAWAFVG